uniref:Uncharacterized protein n=1 Tax=Anguilla anguilla TaxID=7936 RepID=A0A0E9RHN4_ANGAN
MNELPLTLMACALRLIGLLCPVLWERRCATST